MTSPDQAPVAIVTGGRRGIGLASATALARDGFDVMLVDLLRDEAADAALAGLRALGRRAEFVAADIADLDAHGRVVEATMAAFGRIDCLVNNAGIGAPVRGDLVDLDPTNFDRVIDVNLRGTVFLTQAVVRRMLADGDNGHPRAIVTITSISADHASPERIDYCISKAGLAMWSKGLALRLAPEGIAVFDVRPGIIRTDMTAGVAARYDGLIAGGLVPARRWGEADDIARAVAALARGDFAFATGTVVQVDGGLAIPRL
jgi:NAD(P)-dependent dehydrogenase (short-subunit alcohol dehydrogenase family)